jgi:hypothetical protein
MLSAWPTEVESSAVMRGKVRGGSEGRREGGEDERKGGRRGERKDGSEGVKEGER